MKWNYKQNHKKEVNVIDRLDQNPRQGKREDKSINYNMLGI